MKNCVSFNVLGLSKILRQILCKTRSNSNHLFMKHDDGWPPQIFQIYPQSRRYGSVALYDT